MNKKQRPCCQLGQTRSGEARKQREPPQCTRAAYLHHRILNLRLSVLTQQLFQLPTHRGRASTDRPRVLLAGSSGVSHEAAAVPSCEALIFSNSFVRGCGRGVVGDLDDAERGAKALLMPRFALLFAAAGGKGT